MIAANSRFFASLALLPGLAMIVPSFAGSDRIFADGFDPCCQIGGTVSGLAGSGLVLHLDAGTISENQPVGANGPYQFAASVPSGTAFTLSVGTQPGPQTCAFAFTSGTIGSADIDNADVSCTSPGSLEWDTGNWGDNWN